MIKSAFYYHPVNTMRGQEAGPPPTLTTSVRPNILVVTQQTYIEKWDARESLI